MQLTPRYDGPPVLSLDGPPGAIAVPAIRQQRRLVDTLAGLTNEQWNQPSRCAGWTARDVAVHAPWTLDIPADQAWMLGGLAQTFDRDA